MPKNSMSFTNPIARLSRLMLLLAALAPAGCRTQADDPRLASIAMPPDFAIEFLQRGQLAGDNPAKQSTYYVVESNRRLRASLGALAESRAFPPIARVLTPAELEALFEFVRDRHLLTEPTSPRAEALRAGQGDGVLYEVTLAAHGATHRYATTPAESPATAQLFLQLEALRASGTFLEPAAPGSTLPRPSARHHHG